MRIIDHFDNAVDLYPRNIALKDVANKGDTGTTYADAAPRTVAIADAIAANGYKAGSHVGVLAPNCVDAFLALLGVFRAQCVWLPINPRNTVPTNADLLERFEDGRVELYNLAEDLGERNNVARQHPDRVRVMRERLHAWYKEVDAKFLRPRKPGETTPWRPQ